MRENDRLDHDVLGRNGEKKEDCHKKLCQILRPVDNFALRRVRWLL